MDISARHEELTRLLPCHGKGCCGRLWPAAHFRTCRVNAMHGVNARSVRFYEARGWRWQFCRRCEQRTRDERKDRNRPLIKCRRAREVHAVRLGIPWRILRDTYGWTDEAMVRSFHAAEGHCAAKPHGCGRAFLNLDGDMTLDIREVTALPFWGVNTQWLCHTCNSRHQNTPADELAISNLCFAQQDDEELAGERYGQLFLEWDETG